MKKACIFDFDGVIVDSERYHYLGWLEVAKVIGTTLTYEEYAPLKSAGRIRVIPYLFEKAGKALKEGDIEKFFKVREEKIAVEIAKLNKEDVMDGVADFLELLNANGIPCAVASASASSTGVQNAAQAQPRNLSRSCKTAESRALRLRCIRGFDIGRSGCQKRGDVLRGIPNSFYRHCRHYHRYFCRT